MSLFAELQEDVGEWSEENFGGQPSVNPVLGCGEEVGELADVIDFNKPPSDEELDAVGDTLVYFADVCSRRELDYEKARDESKELEVDYENFFREWVDKYGYFQRSVLKREQGIRLDEDRVGIEAEQNTLAQILCCLDNLANERGYDLEECVRVAWYDEVIDREWDSSYN